MTDAEVSQALTEALFMCLFYTTASRYDEAMYCMSLAWHALKFLCHD